MIFIMQFGGQQCFYQCVCLVQRHQQYMGEILFPTLLHVLLFFLSVLLSFPLSFFKKHGLPKAKSHAFINSKRQ